MKQEKKTSTVFIRGIPLTTKDQNLHDAFANFGKIRQAFVTKGSTQNECSALLGYVKFTTIDEATKAINSLSTINGKKVTVSYARKKPRKYRTPPVTTKKDDHEESGLSDTDEENNKHVAQKQNNLKHKSQTSPQKTIHTKTPLTGSFLNESGTEFPRNDKTIYIKNLPKTIKEKDIRIKCRKIGKVSKILVDTTSAAVTFEDQESAVTAIKKLNNHVFKQQVISVMSSQISDKAIKKFSTPSRVIIRNLSFKVTEEILRSHFTKFGSSYDLSVPKKEDGKIKGFAFVSFMNKFEANKAIQKLNGKEILGRKVAVDWAISKDKFISKTNDDNIKDDSTNESIASQNEEESEEEGDSEDNEVKDNDVTSKNVELEYNVNSGDDDTEDGIEQHPKRQYDDVKEGKTIFMGNLPFDVEKDDIEDTFSVFGDIRYIRMVYDHEKDRPKGIAFLQFKEKHDADSCLERHKVNPICMGSRTITISRAVDKNDSNIAKLTGKTSLESKGKDNRNLHLAMEGAIKEGTNAANGVSKTDLMKRKLAMEAKKKKLKNVNFYVSTTRLCIRNMPPKLNETGLKQIMSKYGHVKQVKIMRDIKQANSDGIGKSKGYGFVEFAKHEAAISALRNLNNNPNTFSAIKRPIIDFAIENNAIIANRGKKVKCNEVKDRSDTNKKSFNQRWKEKREKRQSVNANEESTIGQTTKNPLKDSEATTQKSKKKTKKKSKKTIKTSIPVQNHITTNETDSQKTSEQSVNVKRSSKGKSERPKKKQKRDQEKNDEAKFQKLVESYKSKLTSDQPSKTFKKWYDD